jgi:hypothetical protein
VVFGSEAAATIPAADEEDFEGEGGDQVYEKRLKLRPFTAIYRSTNY